MIKSFFKWLFNRRSFKSITKNCPCYDKDGNLIGWFSRSISVVTATFLKDNGKICVLASKRGKGTPDPEFIGAWNLCCGYLDFSETCKDAAIRETREETGIVIPKNNIYFDSINDDPRTDKRQNVTIRYYAVLEGRKESFEALLSHKYNEKDEVDEIKFIELTDVVNYNWAFNHARLIASIYQRNKLRI